MAGSPLKVEECPHVSEDVREILERLKRAEELAIQGQLSRHPLAYEVEAHTAIAAGQMLEAGIEPHPENAQIALGNLWCGGDLYYRLELPKLFRAISGQKLGKIEHD